MKTTLNEIRSHAPCTASWAKLLAHFGKTEADGTEVRIVEIIDLLGVKDALWALRAVAGHDREKRLLAVAFARRVKHKMRDPRSLNALDVAERFANGEATKEEFTTARDAAYAAAYMAAYEAYWAASDEAYAARAASEAAYEAAYWAASDEADVAAADAADDAIRASDDREAERAWQAEELRRVCLAIEAGENPYPKKEIQSI